MPISKLKSEELLDYCRQHSKTDSSLLSNLEQYTWENEDVPQMFSGPLVGKFLQSIIRMINAKRIVEVGTFTGYSALQMAEALPIDGEIHTCELMEKHANTAQLFIDQSGYESKITIHQGPALQNLEQLQANSFDMAFIDADKPRYLEYYKHCLMLVRQGGIIVLDNMLWGGDVIDPQSNDSKVLRKTGDYIQQDGRVFNLLLPIRDGLMFCIKNEK